MKKQRPERDKTLINAAYAGRFPRRKKKERRKERKVRTLVRELNWLLQTGVDRDPEVPLVSGQRREKGRYTP